MSRARYRYGMNWIRQAKRLAIYLRDHFACLYCGTGIEQDEGMRLALDHVQHRGSNDVTNLVTCCMDCNRTKSCWSLEFFLRKLPHSEQVQVQARVAHALKTSIADLLPQAKALIAARKNPF